MNTNNTQSNENEVEHLKDVFGGLSEIADLSDFADDLSMLLTMAVASDGFSEIHPNDRSNLTFRTLELIKTFRAAS